MGNCPGREHSASSPRFSSLDCARLGNKMCGDNWVHMSEDKMQLRFHSLLRFC